MTDHSTHNDCNLLQTRLLHIKRMKPKTKEVQHKNDLTITIINQKNTFTHLTEWNKYTVSMINIEFNLLWDKIEDSDQIFDIQCRESVLNFYCEVIFSEIKHFRPFQCFQKSQRVGI